MDTERSEMAESISITGHTIDWNAAERLASCGEKTMIHKIREAVDMLFQRNLMNGRLEEGRVSDNFAYDLSRLGDSAKTSKRTTVQQQDETSSR
ncbi:unnamed protein product [Protopolystoma xenopodis]|uniref:Uncharacterized protein n=1 Tax=Protopolystoma xenopodis TaxID=117903 RepID=A0A3S5AF75_9PLAT|nr:unnamed protein product [Protopolystoma xenopodis]